MKIFRPFLLALFVSFLVYLSFAFASACFNISYWNHVARGICAILMLVSFVFVFVFVIGFKE